ncbi:hypothetical protein ACFYVR_06775 [Rhodococcus sp. NPDC003318]|uniref:hypothetical protein n=1 Tax=Rhodococcus sp. NPDC003318 TaxID=3364503 RepID=UPI00368F8745
MPEWQRAMTRHFDVTAPAHPRSATLPRPSAGSVADAATQCSTDAALGHATFRTLGDMATSALTDEQAACLGRLVRIVNGPAGLPGGFDTAEELYRSHLATWFAAATGQQTRAAVQRALDGLRTPAATP